jgi:hypothetical protein
MNTSLFLALFCSLFSSTPKSVSHLGGDYVEARTASVFAGPCHFNGELVTTGNDAVMAWQFDSGVRVMAVVSCDANLANAEASRRSEIIVDNSAGPAATAAAVNAILSHEASSLGKLVAIRQEKISFHHAQGQYEVEGAGFASLTVDALPDGECCKQPNLVWYTPLAHLTGRMVGYTENAAYFAGNIGDSWQRGDENSAFYGAFSY